MAVPIDLVRSHSGNEMCNFSAYSEFLHTTLHIKPTGFLVVL